MKGEVVYLFAFDVAGEIATARIPAILFEKPLPFEIRIERSYPRDMPPYKPLAAEPVLTVSVNGQPVRGLVRVYEVGAITVALRVAFEVGQLQEFVSFHNHRSADGQPLDLVARQLCDQVRNSLQEFLVHPTPSTEPEAYTAFCLTELEGVQDVNEWLAAHRREVAGLLTETAPDRLSEAQVGEVLRLQRSFEKADLVVIDWDAAVVINLGG